MEVSVCDRYQLLKYSSTKATDLVNVRKKNSKEGGGSI